MSLPHYLRVESSSSLLNKPRLSTLSQKYVILVVVFGSLFLCFARAPFQHLLPTTSTESNDIFNGDLRRHCKEQYFTQTLNHFEQCDETYQQRYFICDPFGILDSNRSIFLYTGNEGNVELYLNHTGLMWENAHQFKAILVFAEHRYFGKSFPVRHDNQSLHDYAVHCSSEQALADFAILGAHLRGKSTTPIIAFGGSYGGMLAAWIRLKYPHLIHGAIASSAPMLSFLGFDPPMDLESFSRIVTYDATPAAGAVSGCSDSIKSSWSHIFRLGETVEGRSILSSIFRTCNPITKEEDVSKLTEYLKGAYDSMAMGNYPYPSSYITSGERILPAYPMRHACKPMGSHFNTPEDLLNALRESVNVFYNSTKAIKCHDIDEIVDDEVDYWDYLSCADMYTPLDTTGIDDMFWRQIHNQTEDERACRETWGVSLRPTWPSILYGGVDAFSQTENIVFTNGEYDPWAPTGIRTSLSSSVVAVNIPKGAHHLDLMFSHSMDPPELQRVRDKLVEHLRQWLESY